MKPLIVLLGLLIAVDGVYNVAVAVDVPAGVDSDGDRCTDGEELGPRAIPGGHRDPANRWDFFDTPVGDQSITIGDIASVATHFGSNSADQAGPPRYDPAFDRSFAGPEPWDLAAPDGVVAVQDIAMIVSQYGHYCRALTPFYTIVSSAFTPRPGATALAGVYSGGGYRIEVPANWNGELVLWAHGFRGNVAALTVDMPPSRDDLLAQGYAWAASSYRENGYVPGYGARDTVALKDLFAKRVAPPERTYLIGASMGGHVTTLSLEQLPGEYDGALSMCGVVSGVEILDYFVATWLPVGAFVASVDLPDLEGQIDPAAFATLVAAVKGELGGPGAYTPAGEQFKSIIINYTGGPRPMASEGFDQQYDLSFFILQDGVNTIAKQQPPGRRGIQRLVSGNDTTVYDVDPGLGLTDAALNAGVLRRSADPQARADSELSEFVPNSGNLSAPLMSIHGTGDLFVPIGLEQSYLEKVQAAGDENLLVQRAYATAGHCNFSAQNGLDAFNDLVSWVETGVRPWGDDLSGDLSAVGH